VTEWDEVMETMTFSRYSALIDRWKDRPSSELLLTYIAMAHGYAPPTKEEPKTAAQAAAELKQMFPTGEIKLGR
jgi:hypothetical protein